MDRDTVIPNNDTTLFPLEPHLKVGSHGNVVKEKLEEVVALLLLEPHDLTRKLRIDEERLFSRHRMGPHKRMFGSNRLAANDTSAGTTILGLLKAAVDGRQTVQPLLECRRKTVVCLGHAGVQRVATGLWTIQDVQERSARRLLLKSHVRMPCDGIRPGRKVVTSNRVFSASVDEVNLGITGWLAAGDVDVVTAKVAAKVQGLLDGNFGEILVPED